MITSTRRGALGAAALALALPLVGVGAGPAAAHTALESSTPANGSVLATSPTTAKLVFSESVTPVAKGFALRSTSGDPASIGAVQRSGKTLTVPIKATLASGGYLLSYSVISDDGHPVKGTIAFRVK